MNVKKDGFQTCQPFDSEGGGHGRTLCILQSTSHTFICFGSVIKLIIKIGKKALILRFKWDGI